MVADHPVVDLDDPRPGQGHHVLGVAGPEPHPQRLQRPQHVVPAGRRLPVEPFLHEVRQRPQGGAETAEHPDPLAVAERLHRVQRPVEILLHDQRLSRPPVPDGRDGRRELGRVADQHDVLAGHTLARLHDRGERHAGGRWIGRCQPRGTDGLDSGGGQSPPGERLVLGVDAGPPVLAGETEVGGGERRLRLDVVGVREDRVRDAVVRDGVDHGPRVAHVAAEHLRPGVAVPFGAVGEDRDLTAERARRREEAVGDRVGRLERGEVQPQCRDPRYQARLT